MSSRYGDTPTPGGEVQTGGYANPRQATDAVVKRHIEAGDISQHDVEVLQDSMKLVSRSAFIGSWAFGAAGYFIMKRRTPTLGLGPKLMVAGGMGVIGTFVGYVIGGVGASMELKSKMDDGPRKMKVFADIVEESRQAVRAHQFPEGMAPGVGVPRNPSRPPIPTSFPRSSDPRPPSTYGGSGSESSTWNQRDSSQSSGSGAESYGSRDMGDDMDRAEENTRQMSYSRDLEQIRRDSEIERPMAFDLDPSPSQPYPSDTYRSTPTETEGRSQAQDGRRDARVDEAGRTYRSAWDRLRAGQPVRRPMEDGDMPERREGLPGVGGIDGRSKEQREFDDMLDKERQGEPETSSWK